MTTPLKLRNTLSGRTEEIVRAEGQPIKMYVCGGPRTRAARLSGLHVVRGHFDMARASEDLRLVTVAPPNRLCPAGGQ